MMGSEKMIYATEKITIVSLECGWEGIYLDDELVYEDHSISGADLLKVLNNKGGLKYKKVSIEEDEDDTGLSKSLKETLGHYAGLYDEVKKYE